MRRCLADLGGRMFWKEIPGGYTYLAQRDLHSSRKVRSLGPKSPDTVSIFEQHTKERDELLEREKSLEERIKLYERMNKAVHAGGASVPVMNALAALESAGVADSALWVGEPAVEAYVQSSGLDASNLTPKRHEWDLMLVFVEKKLDAQAISKVQRAKDLCVDAISARTSTVLLFQLKEYTSSKSERHIRPATKGLEHFLHYSHFLKDTLKDKFDLLRYELQDKPSFEQVVIGKSGKMGVMRTVDPSLFESFSTFFAQPAETRDLVHQLLDEKLLSTKVSASA